MVKGLEDQRDLDLKINGCQLPYFFIRMKMIKMKCEGDFSRIYR